MNSRTTINISSSTKEELSKLGKFGQSYDAVIKKLIESVKRS